jgi:hypothetical protein
MSTFEKKPQASPDLHPSIFSGVEAPDSTPSKIGDIFVDTALAKVYVSTGTSSSDDWSILN